MQQLTSSVQSAAAGVIRLWQRLTEPHPSILSHEERRRARLLSALILVLILDGLVVLGTGIMRSPSIELFALTFPAYVVSRTRYHRQVAWFITGLAAVGILVIALSDQNAGFLFAMIMPLILSAILLSQRTTLLFCLYALVAYFIVHTVYPMTVFDGSQFLLMAAFAALLMIYIRHRDAVEGDRQGELRARQTQLEAANADLEREIQERKAIEEKMVVEHALLEQMFESMPVYVAELEKEIEERKQTEQKLAAERNLLQTIIENVPDYIFSKDAEGRFTMSNSAHGSTFGRDAPPTVFIGKTSLEAFPEPFGRQFYEDDMQVIRSGVPMINVERLTRDAEGNPQWVWTSKIPLQDEQGQVTGLVGISRDVTERKRAEEEVARSRSMLRLVLDSIPEYVFWKDQQSIFQGCNRMFAELLGMASPDDVIGKHDSDLVPSTLDMRRYAEEDHLVLSGQSPILHYEEDLVLEGQHVYRFVTKVPLVNSQDEIIGVLGVVSDMTAQKNAEEEIRRLNEELEERVIERTQQLEAMNAELEAFAHSVSHDLRAPLRAINGFSQILLDDYGIQLDATGQEYLHRQRMATQRMGRLIDDLLQLSRVTRREIHVEPVDLSAIAQEIAAELQGANPERQVRWDIQPGIMAEGDAGLLRILLNNLLSNAWKFTGKKPYARIAFHCEEQDGQRRYSIADDGVGFDPAYAQKLFTAFQRLHSPHDFEGTGIGLATARRIIMRHGGTIEAHSQPDQGAVFTFTF
ncbi:MAG: PAS domain-containing protein [Anaerolineae bacterium]|nr:PAS domain-containing protein [Anaerolineae bacterium]